MDVRLLRQRPPALYPYLLPEVQDGVHDRRRDARERQPVRHRERRREEERRVLLVLLEVERRVRREDARDVVHTPCVIVRRPRRHRHVLRVPRVRVVHHRREHPEEEHEPDRDVRRGPPRRREGRADVRDLRPVEGDERHPEAGVVPEQLVDHDVVRRDPAHPVEVAERLEDVAGEEEPDEGAEEGVEEEPLARDASAVPDPSVLLRVQRVEERTGHQICRPDHGGRCDEETSCDAPDGEPDLPQVFSKSITLGTLEDVLAVWTSASSTDIRN